jgi:predicted dehydrogenase
MQLNRFGETVRLAVIGLGCRGVSQMGTLLEMPDVDVTAVCDVYEYRVAQVAQIVEKARGKRPFASTAADECMDRSDVDAVIIMTSWETHVPLCLKALQYGKRPAMEVGGASSVEECWRMVRASEETGIPVMLLENCCYGRDEMTVLNMARKGLFGELVHAEGGYQHDLRDEVSLGHENRHYRLDEYMHRNGEIYPTHELGPIAKYLNINRGNRMVSLVSMASKAAGLHAWLKQHRPDTPLADAQVNEGDVVTTLIKCANGETIQLNHDCTLPRPYSRAGVIQGTKGIWMEDNRSIYIEDMSPGDNGHWTHRWESDEEYMKRYEHPLWKEYEVFGLRGGHGGMDYLALRAFVESVQKNETPPIDTYDTASWMAITALSEESVAMGSMPVPIPDFTGGRWLKERKSKATGEYALD